MSRPMNKPMATRPKPTKMKPQRSQRHARIRAWTFERSASSSLESIGRQAAQHFAANLRGPHAAEYQNVNVARRVGAQRAASGSAAELGGRLRQVVSSTMLAAQFRGYPEQQQPRRQVRGGVLPRGFRPSR